MTNLFIIVPFQVILILVLSIAFIEYAIIFSKRNPCNGINTAKITNTK